MLLTLIPKGFFSRQARKPEGIFGRYLMSYLFRKGNESLNGKVLGQMGLSETDSILEVGFGPGSLIKAVAANVTSGKVYGVDFSRAMLQSACKLNQKNIDSGRVQLLFSDSIRLPFPDSSFDKLCTVNTLYFWPDPKQQLKEFLRVLKPAGKLVIGFRDSETLESLKLDSQIFNFYTSEEVAELLRQSGFDQVRLQQHPNIALSSMIAEGCKAMS
ncbi:MAG: class I SAM-dependent methyltransferase [Endozoicomonas sp.]|uniref:class I SAM-dependent methyltransferase n=1 Tax=Endozoicomonas sp. TaxID=1892382 RepID=UPI003D9BCD30